MRPLQDCKPLKQNNCQTPLNHESSPLRGGDQINKQKISNYSSHPLSQPPQQQQRQLCCPSCCIWAGQRGAGEPHKGLSDGGERGERGERREGGRPVPGAAGRSTHVLASARGSLPIHKHLYLSSSTSAGLLRAEMLYSVYSVNVNYENFHFDMNRKFKQACNAS